MKVCKFGGSILKNADNIKQISKVIEQNHYNINVFSAFFSMTDALIKTIDLANKQMNEYKMQLEMIENHHINICKELDIDTTFVTEKFIEISNILDTVYNASTYSPKIQDEIIANGELLSSLTVYNYLLKSNKNVNFIDTRKCIKTDSNFTNAQVNIALTRNLMQTIINKDKINIITGFIASDLNNNTTTLGRNGSDYTAALIANIIKAEEIVIWKDVDGVFTANPKIVPSAMQINQISYKEMAELSYFGSKVISLNALQPAIDPKIPICIRSLNNIKNKGTIISTTTDESLKIKWVSKVDNIILFSVNGFNMMGISGFAKRVFGALNKKSINIIFIAQSSSEISICFGINTNDEDYAKEALNSEFNKEVSDNSINFTIKNDQSIISIAGYGMTNSPGIAGQIFSNLGMANININAIAHGLSEMNISCVVNNKDADKALKLIHNAIFENKQINCLIAGNGVVGSSVIKMLNSQKEYFQKKGIDINIIGVFDSKNITIDGKINKYNDLSEVISMFKDYASINYALIDCTSSDKLVENYKLFIENGFNIVTPNKKANTLEITKFQELLNCFKMHKKHFFYEANVGAGLPIISTIKDLIDCGDEIIKIEGIFSGTLSYIFNNLSKDKKFSEIVLDAQKNGFTEPDPKDDLCGADVGRKLLILCRMLGMKINLSDIKIESLVDLSDDKIQQMLDESSENVLRYVGTIENNAAYAKIISIPKDHSLASTQYTDNVISITTKFYKNTPLVIKGPGAGADVTATGILSDIIKLSSIL